MSHSNMSRSYRRDEKHWCAVIQPNDGHEHPGTAILVTGKTVQEASELIKRDYGDVVIVKIEEADEEFDADALLESLQEISYNNPERAQLTLEQRLNVLAFTKYEKPYNELSESEKEDVRAIASGNIDVTTTKGQKLKEGPFKCKKCGHTVKVEWTKQPEHENELPPGTYCAKCGTKVEESKGSEVCPQCKGKGKILNDTKTCPTCGGSGTFYDSKPEAHECKHSKDGKWCGRCECKDKVKEGMYLKEAKCKDCGLEMMTTPTCKVGYVRINGVVYPRDTKYYDVNNRCHDCNIVNKEGNFHHPGCDIERCPKCGGQNISCGCGEKEYLVSNPNTESKEALHICYECAKTFRAKESICPTCKKVAERLVKEDSDADYDAKIKSKLEALLKSTGGEMSRGDAINALVSELPEDEMKKARETANRMYDTLVQERKIKEYGTEDDASADQTVDEFTQEAKDELKKQREFEALQPDMQKRMGDMLDDIWDTIGRDAIAAAGGENDQQALLEILINSVGSTPHNDKEAVEAFKNMGHKSQMAFANKHMGYLGEAKEGDTPFDRFKRRERERITREYSAYVQRTREQGKDPMSQEGYAMLLYDIALEKMGESLKESLSELIHEAPGLTEKDKEMLEFYFEKHEDLDHTPDYNIMVDSLKKVGKLKVGAGIKTGTDAAGKRTIEDIDQASIATLYLMNVILPRAKEEFMGYKDESNEAVHVPTEMETYYRRKVLNFLAHPWKEPAEKEAVRVLSEFEERIRNEPLENVQNYIKQYAIKYGTELASHASPEFVERLRDLANEDITEQALPTGGTPTGTPGTPSTMTNTDKRQIVARGIVDKSEAERIANSKRGNVISDEDDPKKWAVQIPVRA